MVSVDTRYLVFGGSLVGRSGGRVKVSVMSPGGVAERSERGASGASLSREIPDQTTSWVLRGLGNRRGCDTCPRTLERPRSDPRTTEFKWGSEAQFGLHRGRHSRPIGTRSNACSNRLDALPHGPSSGRASGDHLGHLLGHDRH